MSDHLLTRGDCLDPVHGMPTLADRSADCFLFDPPYSARVHERLGLEDRNDGTEAREELRFCHLTRDVCRSVAKEAARICKSWILVFCDTLVFHWWAEELESAGAEYIRNGTWVKTSPMPQMSGDRPAAGTEEIVVAHAPRPPKSGRMKWNGGGKPATYTGPSREPGVERYHPAQKPLWLCEALLRDFTQPGHLVVDPFAGVASTGVACKRTGRRFRGFELDPAYEIIGNSRIANAREQLSLLEAS